MPKTLSLAGTLQFQPTEPARPAPIPVAFSGVQYTHASQQDLVFTAAQATTVLNDGTITAPKLIYIEVVSGAADISKAANNANPFTIAANPTPAANEQAAFLMLYTYGANAELYVTTPGPAQLRVWFFQ
jgi:subtilase family serine protease